MEQAVALAKEDRKNRTLILLLGRGSERFQQIGGRSLASPTDAELMAEALQAYDASRKPGEASCSGKNCWLIKEGLRIQISGNIIKNGRKAGKEYPLKI